MKFKINGFIYEYILKPKLHKTTKKEYLKYISGYKNLWERITEKEYNNALCEFKNK